MEELDAARADAAADAEAARGEARHREEMLAFVEKEVHSVKALFAEKEASLQSEARRREGEKEGEVRVAMQALAEAEAAGARAKAEAQAAEKAKVEAEGALAAMRADREKAVEQLASKSGEVTRACEEKGRVEAEMRLVLKAMDAQKQAANRNMAQLSKMYDDWNAAQV